MNPTCVVGRCQKVSPVVFASAGVLGPLRDGWGTVGVDCWGTGIGGMPPMGRGVCPLAPDQSSFLDGRAAREGRLHVKCGVQRVSGCLLTERDVRSNDVDGSGKASE